MDEWARPQVWSQWEEDSAWSDSLLTTFQASFPKVLEEEDSEEQISTTRSVYQVRGTFLVALHRIFRANRGAGVPSPLGTLIQT